jgi:4-amino-4-deoxy-L-arabinose transferase-like glycosyltransferase
MKTTNPTTDPPPSPDPAGGTPGRDVVLVLAGAFALLAAFAWVRDLWDADEGRYASVALDMLRRGDLVTPHEAGMRFVDKPPLLYWVEIAAFALLGAVPFAARLPCLLAGAALCAIVFRLALRLAGDRRAAWCAAGVAATSLAGMAFSRTVTMDMPLSACIAGALLAALSILEGGRAAPRVGLGVAVGLGLLAKGPLAAVVPAVVALSWAVVGVSGRRLLRAALSPTAWLVALAIAAPWYALMERANPGYLEHFVVYEHFGRFTEEGHRHFRPIWLYLAVLPLGLLPWTHLVLGAGNGRLGLPRLRRPLEIGRKGPVPAERLAWAWAIGCLLFFTAGRARLFTYVLPAFPPLFVLLGARLAQRLETDDGARRLAGWAFAHGVLVAVAGAVVASGLAHDRGLLVDDRLRALGVPAALAALGLLAAPLVVATLRRPAAKGAALVLATAALWWGVDLAAAHVDSMRSARALAETLARAAGPDDLIVSLDRYPQGVRFYSDLDVRIAENPRPGRRRTQREIVEPWATRDGAGRLLTMAELRSLWEGPQRVLLVARALDAKAEFPSARVLATDLSGAQRADLVVAENRPRRR